MKASLFAIAASALIASSTFAGGPNGIVVLHFSFTQQVYVDCLSEEITHEIFIEARDHTIATPSGTTHIVDNWIWSSYDVGTVTGRVWTGHGVAPGNINFKLDKGGVNHWVVNARFTPLDADDPTWMGKNQFQLTTNANGDVVVFHDVDPNSEVFRCIGPNA